MDNEHTFRDLLAGKIDYLQIAICVPTTKAKREFPTIGIWRLTRNQFVKIAENLQVEDFPNSTSEQIAELCDEAGIYSRFFRLNPVVAAWIDDNEPEVILDGIIM